MQLLWLDAGYNGHGKGKDWAEWTTTGRVETVKGIHWRKKYYWVPNDIPPDHIDWSLYAPSPQLPRYPTALGGRADLRLAVAQSSAQQRLRAALRHLQGADLPGDDSSHGARVRALLRAVFISVPPGSSSFVDLLGPPMEQRGGADTFALSLEDGTPSKLGVFQVLDGGEVLVDERRIGERPEMLSGL